MKTKKSVLSPNATSSESSPREVSGVVRLGTRGAKTQFDIHPTIIYPLCSTVRWLHARILRHHLHPHLIEDGKIDHFSMSDGFPRVTDNTRTCQHNVRYRYEYMYPKVGGLGGDVLTCHRGEAPDRLKTDQSVQEQWHTSPAPSSAARTVVFGRPLRLLWTG